MSLIVHGSDFQVSVFVDGAKVACVSNVQSMRVNNNTEAILRDFLGEKAPRTDMVFRGVEFELEVLHDDPSFLTLVNKINAVAQHRTPGVVFSIGFVINYPSGRRVRAMMRDVAFDSVPLEFGGRMEPFTSRLSGKCGTLSNISGSGAL